MTLDEANTVARIAITADGGCSGCTADLFYQLNRDFPEYVWEIVDSYNGSFVVRERVMADPVA